MNAVKVNEVKQANGANGREAEALNELNQLNREEGADTLAARAGLPGKIVETQPRVDGQLLLDELEEVLRRFVVLPESAAETLALWVVHTYAFELREVSTYLGIESPEKRCGKTTLLGVLSKLVNRPVAAANISSSAFFRVIEEMRPTLLIDEADTFLRNNDELRGILNAGYTRETAYVIRTQALDRTARNADHGTKSSFVPSSSNPLDQFNSSSPSSCNPCNSFNLKKA